MFEIPEYVTLARQMGESLSGKRIASGTLGNSPHRFVWYNLKLADFSVKVKGKVIGKPSTRGRWLFVPVEMGYVLVFGECGGKILFHKSASDGPKKYHLLLCFDDGTALSAFTQMWGAMELYQKGEELKRKYIKDMRTTPVDRAFSVPYLRSLIKDGIAHGNRTVKAILTQNQLIPGLGNAIAQDIMFNAGLHPKQPVEALSPAQVSKLHRSIVGTVKKAIRLGGRNDEYDLFGVLGKYQRIMDKNAAGRPCPRCGTKVEKIAYLGGACYFCPQCQKIKC